MMQDKKKLKVIGFDADDTLWINEPYYRETEQQFCLMMEGYCNHEETSARLFDVETKNMNLYGYGIKAFMLSVIETALLISGGKTGAEQIGKIIELGKTQLTRINEILPGVRETLLALSARYRLIVATKGDLLDQEKKLANSGLLSFFHHIEIMSDKKPENYRRLLSHLDIEPEDFMMVGNSIRSDVLPVLEIGGSAVHIPFHTTWIHEEVPVELLPEKRYIEINTITELLDLF